MSSRQKNYDVGYMRPPKTMQWKKGQCGNPKRQYRRAAKGTVELIDAVFAEQIEIVEKGESRPATVFEAILLQISSKEISGDKRATAARLRYQEFILEQAGPREFIIRHEYPGGMAETRTKNERL